MRRNWDEDHCLRCKLNSFCHEECARVREKKGESETTTVMINWHVQNICLLTTLCLFINIIFSLFHLRFASGFYKYICKGIINKFIEDSLVVLSSPLHTPPPSVISLCLPLKDHLTLAFSPLTADEQWNQFSILSNFTRHFSLKILSRSITFWIFSIPCTLSIFPTNCWQICFCTFHLERNSSFKLLKMFD